MSVSIGEQAPDFELPDTTGATWSPAAGDGDGDADGKGVNATVIVFTCNHCPYALAWQDRVAQVARDYADRGVRVLAINANDSDRYPRDSFDAMRRRVDAEHWPMPYLHDQSQDVARAYGAKTTPDVFVLDDQRRLRYRGAPDSDYDDPSQNAAWLRAALDAVLSGEEPARPETKPVGCSIKWKR